MRSRKAVLEARVEGTAHIADPGLAPCSSLLAPCSQAGGFDQDGGGSVMAKRQATTIYHADERAAATDFGNEGAFAEAHFPDSLAKGGFSGERAYAAGTAGGQLAKRKGLRMETVEDGGHETGSQIRLSLTVNEAVAESVNSSMRALPRWLWRVGWASVGDFSWIRSLPFRMRVGSPGFAMAR